ncbi:hypothetical protein NP493_1932g00003, partial [Ridgeia piscesae]
NVYKVEVRLRDRVSVTGPGVGRVPVNHVTSFTVLSECGTKLALSVTITTPSGKSVENCILDDGNGSYLVKYTPTEVGTYPIELFCAGGKYSRPLSSEAFDTAAVTVRNVSKYTVGEKFEFQISPVRLDSYCPAPTVRLEQSIARTDSEPTQQHPLPGSAKTPGSSQNGSMSGQSMTSSVALEDELWSNDRYRPRPNIGTRATTNTAAGTYPIEVFCAGGKYSGPLSSEAFDTAAVTVRKVSKYTVGEKFEFQINTTRAGDGVLKVSILREVNRFEDDSVIPHAMTGVNGLYSVTFTPSTRHPTYATIMFNSTELPRTYPIQVFCAGGKYSGPLSSEAFDTAAVTVRKVSKYTVGEKFEFQINTSRAGDGVLKVSILREVNRFEDDSVIPHAITGVNGLYSVTFTPSTRHPTYATIMFNSTELPLSPVRLDSYCHHIDSGLTQQHPYSGTATTSGSSQNGSMSGDSSDEDSAAYVDMNQHRHSFDSSSAGTAASSVALEDELWSNDRYRPRPNGGTRATTNTAAVCDALRSSLNNGSEHIVVTRNDGLVNDVLLLYKDKDVATKTLYVEFLGEPETSNEISMLQMFRTFWMLVANELFDGEERLVPSVPLERARTDLWKFECLGRILSHTVALTGRFPSMLARTVLISLASDLSCDDECLLDDFFHFVTPQERDLLKRAMSDFSGLTDEEYDRLRNLYAAHGYYDTPKQSEIKEQVLNIAYQDLVATPGALISEMHLGIPASHKAAFWQRLSADDITHILQR